MSDLTNSTSTASTPIRRFARHYLEMVIAMFTGMVVLGLPLVGLLYLAGSSYPELQDTAPAVLLLGMGIVMAVPMVAWMRYRGHGWQPSMEMAGSMIVPTLAVIGLLAAGVLDFDGAMAIEHIAMFPAMLAVMLARWDEYSAPHDHRAQVAAAAG
jgi:hypothetical protein